MKVIEWLKEKLAVDVVGQAEAVDFMLAALGASSHVLLEGPPGVAKTLLAQEIAELTGHRFKRAQLTPDLLPADLLGTSVWLPNEGRFEFRPGPVFTDVLLADELNRAPPKTQAALLEAMQEKRVTLDGDEHRLGEHFWVIATQNPLEHEGTFPLPESSLDRFGLRVTMTFPDLGDSVEILERHRRGGEAHERFRKRSGDALAADDLEGFRAACRAAHVDGAVLRYIAELVHGTQSAKEFRGGAGPRAGLALLDVGRALAVVRGRDYLVPDDVRDLFGSCVGHRLRLTPEAVMDGLDMEGALRRVLGSIPVPEVGAVSS